MKLSIRPLRTVRNRPPSQRNPTSISSPSISASATFIGTTLSSPSRHEELFRGRDRDTRASRNSRHLMLDTAAVRCLLAPRSNSLFMVHSYTVPAIAPRSPPARPSWIDQTRAPGSALSGLFRWETATLRRPTTVYVPRAFLFILPDLDWLTLRASVSLVAVPARPSARANAPTPNSSPARTGQRSTGMSRVPITAWRRPSTD